MIEVRCCSTCGAYLQCCRMIHSGAGKKGEHPHRACYCTTRISSVQPATGVNPDSNPRAQNNLPTKRALCGKKPAGATIAILPMQERAMLCTPSSIWHMATSRSINGAKCSATLLGGCSGFKHCSIASAAYSGVVAEFMVGDRVQVSCPGSLTRCLQSCDLMYDCNHKRVDTPERHGIGSHACWTSAPATCMNPNSKGELQSCPKTAPKTSTVLPSSSRRTVPVSLQSTMAT
jgi:hypothetical protein